MKKKVFPAGILFALIGFLTVIAEDSPPGADRRGAFRYGELSFVPTVIHGPGWNVARIQPAAVKRDGGGASARHEVTVPGGTGGFSWSLRAEGPGTLQCRWKFSGGGADISHRYIDVEVPAQYAG